MSKKNAPAPKDATQIAAHNANMIAKAAANRLAKQAAKGDTKAVKTKPVLTIVPAEAPVPEAVVTTPETVTTEATPTPVPPAKAKGKKATVTTPDAPKKLSALDAAAKVLAEAGTPLNTKAMIEAMAAKKYWSSPGGKTPAATLYSAILREIDTKKAESRFRKAAKGLFEATGT
jgi:hypothetical protein